MEAFCFPIPLRLHLSTFLHDQPQATFPPLGPVDLRCYRFGHWLDPGPLLPYTPAAAMICQQEGRNVTPSAFIRKWKASNLKERSASQEHFIDLCRLLDEPTPAETDPDGHWYCFERGASKLSGGDGWADVWKRGSFSWEYKGKHKDLQAAYVQL